MDPRTKLERNARVVNMRRDGATYREIGEELGISRQRAQQIYKRMTTIHIDPRNLRKFKRWVEMFKP